MNPIFSSDMAEAHRQDLLREAEKRRLHETIADMPDFNGNAHSAPAHTSDCGDTPSGIGRAAASVVRLRDGASVGLRTAVPADVSRLRDMFFRLSATTRYLYFGVGIPATETWAERVAALGRADGDASYALVAEASDALVGVARFDRAPREPVAELGLLLADAWQSQGLGRAVVAWLRDEAVCRGIAGFTAIVLGENRRAFRLLRRAFPAMRASLTHGQYELAMPFGPAPSLQSAAR